MSYPILVEKYDAKHPADLAVCEGTCGRVWRWDPSQGDPYDQCAECRCGGSVVFKYMVADKCGACGELGFFDLDNGLNGCCSRRCMLAAEHAASLKAARLC